METLIWILAAYGMSQILVFGSIFEKPRNWITKSMCTFEYSNIFFDGMLASGSVWALNAIIEWFEENKPPKDDDSNDYLDSEIL